MAQKKDEAQQAADRAAQQATERGAQQAAGAGEETGRAAQEGMRTAEDFLRRQAGRAEEGMRRGAEEGERVTEGMRRLGRKNLDEAANAGRAQTEQIGRMVTASASVYRDLAESSRRDMERLANSNARIFNALQEMGWEGMRVASDGMRTGMNAVNQISRCRSVEDLAAVQRDILRETMDRMFEGSARLMRIGCDAASEVADSLQEQQRGRSEMRPGM